MSASEGLPFQPLRFFVTWSLLAAIVFTSILEVNAGASFSRKDEPVKLLFEPGTIDFGLANDYAIVESNVIVTNIGRQDITVVDVDLTIPATNVYVPELPIKIGRRQKVSLNIHFIPAPVEAILDVINGSIRFSTSNNGISDQLFIRYKPSPSLWGLKELNDNHTQAQDSSLISLNITNTQATELVIDRVFEYLSHPYPTTFIYPPKGGWPITIPPGVTATVGNIKSIVTSPPGNHHNLIGIKTVNDNIIGVIPFNTGISSIDGLHFHPQVIDFGLIRPDDYFLPHLELLARYDGSSEAVVDIYNVTYLSYKDNTIEVKADINKPLMINNDDYVLISNVWIDDVSSAFTKGIIDISGCLLIHTNISSTPIRIGVRGRVSNRLPRVYYPDGEVKMQYWIENGRVTSIDDITIYSEWGNGNIIQFDKAKTMDDALKNMIKVDIIPSIATTGTSIKISLNHSYNILDRLDEDDLFRIFTKPNIIALHSIDNRQVPLALRLYTNRLIIRLYNEDDMESYIYDGIKDKEFPLSGVEYGGNVSIMLSINNPNPTSISIINGLRIINHDDGDRSTMGNYNLKNDDIVLPPDSSVDISIMVHNITDERNIVISGRTSREQEISIKLKPSLLSHEEITKAQCIVINEDNGKYQLISKCVNPSSVNNINSLDTRIEFHLLSNESSSEGMLATGRIVIDNLPIQLGFGNDTYEEVLVGKGSRKAREIEWLTDRYSLVKRSSNKEVLKNKISLSGDHWRYYIQTPWVVIPEQRTSILAPYQGEIIGLRLIATIGSCKGARILLYNPLKHSPINVRIGYIVTDDDTVMAFSSGISHSSIYGKVYQIPPLSYTYIPALRFCRYYRDISYNGIIYVINNYTTIEPLSFTIPSLYNDNDYQEDEKEYNSIDKYNKQRHPIDIPLPSTSLVRLIEDTPVVVRLELIYSIAIGSNQLAVSYGDIPFNIPYSIRNEIVGGKISKIEFIEKEEGGEGGGGCNTTTGYRLITPLCDGNVEEDIQESITVNMIVPILLKGEYDISDDADDEVDIDTNVIIIINDKHDNTYRLLASIEGLSNGRMIDMIDNTLAELIKFWPPGQIRAYLNKKVSNIIEVTDDGHKVLHKRPLIELLETAIELSGGMPRKGEVMANINNTKIKNNNNNITQSKSRLSLIQVISILFITGLASLKITWRGTKEKKEYITRYSKMNTILKKKNNNKSHKNYYDGKKANRSSNVTSAAGEGGGGVSTRRELAIRDGLVVFFTNLQASKDISKGVVVSKDSTDYGSSQQEKQQQQDTQIDSMGLITSSSTSSSAHQGKMAALQQQQRQHKSAQQQQHRVLLTNTDVVVDQPTAVKLKKIQSAVEASMAIQSKPSVIVNDNNNTIDTNKNKKNKPTTNNRHLVVGASKIKGDKKVKGGQNKGGQPKATPIRLHKQQEEQGEEDEGVKGRKATKGSKGGLPHETTISTPKECHIDKERDVSDVAKDGTGNEDDDDSKRRKDDNSSYSLDDNNKDTIIEQPSISLLQERQEHNSNGVQPFDDALQPQTLSASLEMLFRQAPLYDDTQNEQEAMTNGVIDEGDDDDVDDLEYDITSLLNSLNREALNDEEGGGGRNTFGGGGGGAAVIDNNTNTSSFDDYGMSMFGYENDIGDALYEPVRSWLTPSNITIPTTTTQQPSPMRGYQQQQHDQAALERSSPFDDGYGLLDSNGNHIRQYYTSREDERNNHHIPPTTTHFGTFGVDSTALIQQQQEQQQSASWSSSAQDDDLWLSQRAPYSNQQQQQQSSQQQETFDHYYDFTSFTTDAAAAATTSSSYSDRVSQSYRDYQHQPHRRRRMTSRNLW